MKPTLLQIGKKAIFSQKFQYLPHSFYMIPGVILSVDKDVIQIYDNEDIKFFYQDLIDVTLAAGQSIE